MLGGGVVPAVGEGPGALVAEYGALREHPPSRERTGRLGDVIAGLLRKAGADAAVRDEDPPVVVFRHGGDPYVMGVAWDGVAGEEFARAVRRSAAGAPVVLLSMAGFAGQVAGADFGRTIMWTARAWKRPCAAWWGCRTCSMRAGGRRCSAAART